MTTSVPRASQPNGNPFLFEHDEHENLPKIAGMTGLVEELGLDEFSSISAPDRIFAPAKGHALGVCFHRNCYDLTDPYVQGHEIRKEASEREKEQNPNGQLLWQESIGLLDLGGGIGGAFPLATFDGAYIAAYFGFYASALVRYRRVELTCNEKPIHKVGVPFTAQRALAMPAGTEFEISGQGRLNASGGGIVGGGFALGPFMAGFAGMSTVSHGQLKEYSITVTAIDGNGKVRVVLRQVRDTTVGTSISMSAGLISPGFDGVNINDPGTLVYLPGNTAAIKAVDNLLDCTSATIESAIRSLNRNVVVAAVDLDLTKDQAKEIYKELLLLSPKNAKRAAKSEDSGIELLEIRENQNEIGFSNAINFFGDKILSKEDVDSNVVGQMIRHDGTKFCYRNNIFEKRFHNFMTGTKSIRWEGVTTGNEASHTESRYFHLKFERDNLDFDATKLTRFLRFSELMGIGLDCFARTNSSTTEELNKLWSKAAHVETEIDVYFTTQGVTQIEEAQKEEAIRAFFRAAVAVETSLEGYPVCPQGLMNPEVEALLQEYKEQSAPRQLFGLMRFRERKDLRQRYTLLTGRRLEEDIKLYKEAREFGEMIDCLQSVRDREPSSEFFRRLGKEKGFQFMTTIGALKLLAGQENTRVGDLRMAGLGHSVRYNGSAQIEGPHDTLHRELTRLPKKKPIEAP